MPLRTRSGSGRPEEDGRGRRTLLWMLRIRLLATTLQVVLVATQLWDVVRQSL